MPETQTELYERRLRELRGLIQSDPALPSSREKSLAMTKIEEAELWLTKTVERVDGVGHVVPGRGGV